MRTVVDFYVRSIGRRMPRTRYQRGSLSTCVPKRGDRPERRLPRGFYWAMWYEYARLPHGGEQRRQHVKIIDREFAGSFRIATDHTGPLTKADAQRVLDLLIARDTGSYLPPNTRATVAMVARDYLALMQPSWGAHMVRTAGNLIEKHIASGRLGECCLADVTEADLQSWVNEYVNNGASRSLLKGLLLHVRAIWKHARKRKIIVDNPTEDLRAKSKKRPSERYLSVDECRRLLSVLGGRDHLIARMFIQLGLRPEELFALRRDDVLRDQLRVDETLVNGQSGSVKTEASAAFVYIPVEVKVELAGWLDSLPGDPKDWLFQTTHGRPGFMNPNNYRNRILKPAAIRAGVGVTESSKRDKNGKPIFQTDVDFRCLRRTCATLLGDRAKDPKSTQAQLGHADPLITLKHYQKAIPETVRAAADQLERELAFGLPDRLVN